MKHIAVLLCFAASIAFHVVGTAESEAPAPLNLAFVCSEQNDLYRLLSAQGTTLKRFDAAAEAIAQAPSGAGILVLADGYPDATVALGSTLFDAAAAKDLRLYVEYPSQLPGLEVGTPKTTQWERGVVASGVFGERLERLRILGIHGCHFVPVEAAAPSIVMARVAGFDTAVYGLPEETHPILFEHPRGNVLVATTKLSQFVTGRYAPAEAWKHVWGWILAWASRGTQEIALDWTPTVRPTYTRGEALSADAESKAVRRCAQWFVNSRILRHPGWPKEALDYALTYNTVRTAPSADWPRGDGSLGLVEGFSSVIACDGSQPMRYAVRNDCMTEAAMALAFDQALHTPSGKTQAAENLLDYTLVDSVLTRGPKRDPKSASYGLVGWALDHPENYWGDDNARAMLSIMATAALLGESRWDEPLVRCLLANLRTTGPQGFREACIIDTNLQERGWESYWQGPHHKYSPHYEGWLWPCFFWAYDKTGFKPFLERSRRGIEALMHAYPKWDWCNRSGAIEHARALLPLAWLLRVDDTPRHRQWLRTIAEGLVELQDECGAIRETIGGGAHGTRSNEEYGTRETSLIQENGDPVADMLYTCNFALIGLHEAAAATGDPFYKKAEDKLAAFLCRIQIRSEAHPELDGAWYRAFDFARWEYWASNADWEWGPWCTESGWTQPWIASTLALRQMNTSLWELTANSRAGDGFDKYQKQMLPDALLAAP